MAKLVDNGKRTEYDSYQEYVDTQDSRFHDYDCPNCLKKNQDHIAMVRRFGVKFKSLLDIGCRDSAYFDGLKAEGVTCSGIDVSPQSVKYAVSKNRNVILGDVSRMSLLFEQKFDLIVSVHSLEHFLEPELAMAGCHKLLNEKGMIAILLPNEGDKIKLSKAHRKKNLLAHVRAYTKTDLDKLMKDAGFYRIQYRLSNNEHFYLAKKIG